MLKSLGSVVSLHNATQMPQFGLGVWRTQEGEETRNAVQWALEAGYRHIDTASIYGNEAGVGEAVRGSGLAREDIFLTTKVWNSDQGHQQTLHAFENSLKRLGLDYIDLYLVHWPVKGKFQDTWKAVEEIYASGRARAIGVSNFLVHHLDALLKEASVVPMVNQVEFHPRLQQPELQSYCRNYKIQLEAWAPIMKGRVNDIPELVEIGRRHGKTAVQVTLRWELQQGIVTIPKSVHHERIVSNAEVFDFELSGEEMAAIEALDRGERVGPHPDHIDF